MRAFLIKVVKKTRELHDGPLALDLCKLFQPLLYFAPVFFQQTRMIPYFKVPLKIEDNLGVVYIVSKEQLKGLNFCDPNCYPQLRSQL